MKHSSHRKEASATRPPLLNILINTCLAIGKLACGILGNAPAMISDAIHSMADVLSTCIVLVGIRLSEKDTDREHPFGHARFESLAALLLSIILLVTGGLIGWSGIENIFSGAYRTVAPPDAVVLPVALVVIVIKLFLFLYNRIAARRYHSTALRADAVHQLSDALASLGAFIGVFAARLGFPIFDPLASLLISLFLLNTAISIFCESANHLIDRSASAEAEEALKQTALSSDPRIIAVALRTRLVGSSLSVEIIAYAPETLSLLEGDTIAEAIRTAVGTTHSEAKISMIAVYPEEKAQGDPLETPCAEFSFPKECG